MAEIFDVVIVGAGHGGAQAAGALRQNGFEGSILMIGEETEPPYERPPLSKEYMAREKTFDRLYIRPLDFWADKAVKLRLATRVMAVDAVDHRLTLSDGEQVHYRELIWATGGSPRKLPCPGAELPGVHCVRNRSDVDAIMDELEKGASKAVIIGGGYIGLEAAAVLRKLGCEVTLLEALPRVLARVAGETLSSFYEELHRSRGVDLRTDVSVAAIDGEARVEGVRLADGELLPADFVIVGIGIKPSIEPLEQAGAKCPNGIEVDEFCRTTLQDIYAIGDCAAHNNSFADNALVRLESVQNANDMATTAAKVICGAAAPYVAVPWFWSNQYEFKLQTVGLNLGYDQTVIRGEPKNNSFSVIYLKQGRVIALDCVNAMKDYVQGRKLVEAGAMIPADMLSDNSRTLKELLAA